MRRREWGRKREAFVRGGVSDPEKLSGVWDSLYLGVFLPILLIKCPKSRQKTLHNFLKLKLTPLDVLWCPMKSPKPRQKIKNSWKRVLHKKRMIQILSPTQTHIQSELSLTHSHLNFHRFNQKIQIIKSDLGDQRKVRVIVKRSVSFSRVETKHLRWLDFLQWRWGSKLPR